MVQPRSRSLVFLALMLTLCGGGCVSSHSGTKIESDSVNKIQKGVTTRAQVEALLGPPTSVTMMSEGRRMLMYQSTESSGSSNVVLAQIPLVGAIVPSGTKTETRTQSLQIMLSKADIVEDYEFSDSTQTVKDESNAFGGSSNTTTTQNVPAK